jgi:hypothetical protein
VPTARDPAPDDGTSDLPLGATNPARRALEAAGYTRLDQLAGVPARELRRLHGVGAKGIALIQAALEKRGRSLG